MEISNLRAWVSRDSDGSYALWVQQAPVFDSATGRWRQHLLRPFSPNRLCYLHVAEVQAAGLAMDCGLCVEVQLSLLGKL